MNKSYLLQIPETVSFYEYSRIYMTEYQQRRFNL